MSLIEKWAARGIPVGRQRNLLESMIAVRLRAIGRANARIATYRAELDLLPPATRPKPRRSGGAWVAPDGREFASLRAAAAAEGCTYQAIQQRVASPGGGWSYRERRDGGAGGGDG